MRPKSRLTLAVVGSILTVLLTGMIVSAMTNSSSAAAASAPKASHKVVTKTYTAGATAQNFNNDTVKYSGTPYSLTDPLRSAKPGSGWEGKQESSLLCTVRGVTCPKWDTTYQDGMGSPDDVRPYGASGEKGDGFVRAHGTSLALAPCVPQIGNARWNSPALVYDSPDAKQWRLQLDTRQSYLLVGEGHAGWGVDIMTASGKVAATAVPLQPTLPTNTWRHFDVSFDGSRLQRGEVYYISIKVAVLQAAGNSAEPVLDPMVKLVNDPTISGMLDRGEGAFFVVDLTASQTVGWVIGGPALPGSDPRELLAWVHDGSAGNAPDYVVVFAVYNAGKTGGDVLKDPAGTLQGAVEGQLGNARQVLDNPTGEAADTDPMFGIESARQFVGKILDGVQNPKAQTQSVGGMAWHGMDGPGRRRRTGQRGAAGR